MTPGQTVQTSVDLYAGKRYNGQIDTLQVGNDTDAILETANVGFGLAVARGSADGIVKPYAADTDDFMGITIRKHTVTNTYDSNTAPEYEADKGIAIRNFGTIVVEVEDAVTAGSNAFVRFTSGAGGTVVGSFRSDADTASAVEVPGVVFAESGEAGDMVRVAITQLFV